MIKIETVTINGKEFQKTYSDEGYKIERDGVKYSEAIDPLNSNRVYTETTEKIEVEEELTEIEEKAKAYDILIGEVE